MVRPVLPRRPRILRPGPALAGVLAGLALASPSEGFDFGVDPASQEVTSLRYEGRDVVNANGVGVHLTGASLGLGTDELEDFSYGKDLLRPVGANFFVNLQFSVSRGTVGAGQIVTKQATGNGAAGDKFALLILRNGRTIGPFLESDAPDHELTPLPPAQSNVDGLSYPSGTKKGVFYTVARGGVKAPSDVWNVAEPGVTAPVLYATGAQLGLVPGDNLDGLAVKDGGVIGSLDAADLVYVSLDAASPSRVTLTGGSEGVVQVWPQPAQVAVAFSKFDLTPAPSEEIDAITAYDPGGEEQQELLTHLPANPFGLLSGELDTGDLSSRRFVGVYTGVIGNRAYYTGLRPGLETDEPDPIGLALAILLDSDLHVVKGGLFPFDRGTSLVDTTTQRQSFHYFSALGVWQADTTVLEEGDFIPGTDVPMLAFNRCGATAIGTWPCFIATHRDASFRPYWSALCRDPSGAWSHGTTFLTAGDSVGGRTLSQLGTFDCSPDAEDANLTHCYGTATTSAFQSVMVHVQASGSDAGPVFGAPEIALDGTSPAPGGGFLSDFGFQTAAGSVVFHGRTTTGGEGIYRLEDGVVVRVADRTTPVPGGSGLFTSFGDDLSNDEGATTFLGNSPGGRGIYTTLTGRLQKIAQVNDVIGGRTISSLTLARDAASRTNVAFGARFADGWESIVVKELPLPFDTADATPRAIEVDVELDPDPAVLGPDPRALLLGDLGTARLRGAWTSSGTTGTIRIPGSEVARLVALQFGAGVSGSFGEWTIRLDVASGAVLSSTASGTLPNGPFGFDADTDGGPWTSPVAGAVAGTTAGFETDPGARKLFCSTGFSQTGGSGCDAPASGSPAPAPYDPGSGFVHQTGPLTLGDVVLWGFLGDQRWLEAPPAPCADTDEDGVCNETDNCTAAPNPTQTDGDGDGYGNLCDADLDQNGIVNFGDLSLLKAAFFGNDPAADLDASGVVNFGDLARMKQAFFGPPGPAAGKP